MIIVDEINQLCIDPRDGKSRLPVEQYDTAAREYLMNAVDRLGSTIDKHGHKHWCNLLHTGTLNTKEDFCDCKKGGKP